MTLKRSNWIKLKRMISISGCLNCEKSSMNIKCPCIKATLTFNWFRQLTRSWTESLKSLSGIYTNVHERTVRRAVTYLHYEKAKTSLLCVMATGVMYLFTSRKQRFPTLKIQRLTECIRLLCSSHKVLRCLLCCNSRTKFQFTQR